MKKKGNKKMPILRQEIIDNPIPTSLFFNKNTCMYTFRSVPIYPKILSPVHTNDRIATQHHKQRCSDGDINDFLSHYRHLLVLVPLHFHDVTSLHPPSFQSNDLRPNNPNNTLKMTAAQYARDDETNRLTEKVAVKVGITHKRYVAEAMS